jgi:hypothetical protein
MTPTTPAPKTTKKLWLFLSLLLVLSGCGAAAPAKSADFSGSGGSNTTATSPQGYPASPAATGGSFQPSQPGFAAEESAAPSPPPPSSTSRGDSSKSASREPAPESRPGLGTEWGESRQSRVHDVTFVRDSSRPFAIATMNYNDARGVAAMMKAKGVTETSRGLSTGGGAITVSIKDSGGNNLEAVRAGDKTLVVGQAGQRYSIVLTNHTGHRFESVVTVDGLDVINGKPGTAENRGYVLLPFATLEIEGFRQSASSVAAFRFASVAESYAAQTGTARNVGVIGVAFFGERGDTFDSAQELQMRDSASPFPADPRFAQPPRR